MKKRKPVVQAVVAFALTVAVLAGDMVPALAVKQSDIDALKEEAGALEEQKEAKRGEIAAVADDISATMEKKAVLDGEIEALDEQIAALVEQITALESQIAISEAELAEAKEREAAKYAVFCERVRAMEEQSRMDYWMILFRATSFSDLLSRLDLVSEIMDADQRVIDELKDVQREIASKQAELEAQKDAAEAIRTEQLSRQAELDVQREAANALIVELEASKSDLEADLDDLSAEEDAVQEKIVELSYKMAEEQREEEARRQAEAAAKSYAESIGGLTTAATSGGYIWPVNSRRINSTFGGRASPGGIGSRNHKGIDIGGVGYSTSVYAAKAGKVIISQYSGSYGNYVVISHGSGNTTLYAHLSRRTVSVGDYVSQGERIGVTGSTGRSTGPHLHFEITENGVRRNPLNYLGGYYLA